MTLATAAAWCVSYSPNRLGVASQFLDSALVFEAGDIARDCFVGRQAGFQVRYIHSGNKSAFASFLESISLR